MINHKQNKLFTTKFLEGNALIVLEIIIRASRDGWPLKEGKFNVTGL